MTVAEIMTSPPVTVDPDTTLYDAIGVMLDHRIGSVVVVDSGPVGILTRSDVLRAIYHESGSLRDQPVRVGMSTNPITTTPATPIDSALNTMEEHGIKKLPVVADLELVGIVTLTDIARHQPERVRQIRDDVERKDDWAG